MTLSQKISDFTLDSISFQEDGEIVSLGLKILCINLPVEKDIEGALYLKLREICLFKLQSIDEVWQISRSAKKILLEFNSNRQSL